LRTYSIGLEKVRVFEPTEDHPDDAVAVSADGEVVCYVDRVSALDGERCMTEAAQRHIRLKMMHRDGDALRFPKVSLSTAAKSGAAEVLRLSLLKRPPRKPRLRMTARIF
jgi:hypothetical protein